MKKKISIFVVFLLICILPACGKNSAVKDVEKRISTIGEIDENSGDKIAEIEKYYEALTENQKDQVENYVELVQAREDYDNLVLTDKIISEINEFIEVEYPTQHQVDEIQSEYDQLSDEQKKKIGNYNDFVTAQELKPFEEQAVVAVKTLKSTLKNGNSLEVSRIRYKVGDLKNTAQPGYVLINYSATNSFGGTLDKTACIDITSKGSAGYWALAILTGKIENINNENYSQYVSSTGEEYEFDVDRIMNHIE